MVVVVIEEEGNSIGRVVVGGKKDIDSSKGRVVDHQ